MIVKVPLQFIVLGSSFFILLLTFTVHQSELQIPVNSLASFAPGSRKYCKFKKIQKFLKMAMQERLPITEVVRGLFLRDFKTIKKSFFNEIFFGQKGTSKRLLISVQRVATAEVNCFVKNTEVSFPNPLERHRMHYRHLPTDRVRTSLAFFLLLWVPFCEIDADQQ